jgi:hypothetical protein
MQSYRLPPGHCIELPGCTLTPDTLTLPFPLRLSEAHQLLMLATVERMRTGIPKRRTPPARHVPSVGQPALSSRGFGSRPPEQRRAIAQQGGRPRCRRWAWRTDSPRKRLGARDSKGAWSQAATASTWPSWDARARRAERHSSHLPPSPRTVPALHPRANPEPSPSRWLDGKAPRQIHNPPAPGAPFRSRQASMPGGAASYISSAYVLSFLLS